MIDGGIQIAHQDVKIVGGVLSFGFVGHGGGVQCLSWLTITDDRASPHAELHDARRCSRSGLRSHHRFLWRPDRRQQRRYHPLRNRSEPPLWNVDPADWVRTAYTIAGRVCTPITAIPVNCPETIAGLLSP
jgi:hypothetical protein